MRRPSSNSLLVFFFLQLTIPYLLFVLEFEEYGLVASFVASIFGGLAIGNNLVKFPALRTNFFCITSFVLLLSNALGGLNSYFNISIFNIDWQFFIRTYNVDNINIINALSLVFAFSLILYQIAIRQFRDDTESNLNLSRFLSNNRRTFLIISVILASVQLFLILTGKVTIQGQVRDVYSEGTVNPVIAILSPIIPIVPLIVSFYLRQSRRLHLNLLLISIMLVEFVWFFLWGRRSMLFMFCMAAIGYFFNQPVKLSFIIKKFVPIAISLFVLSSIVDFYQRIRIVGGVDILKTITLENLKTVYELSSSLQSSDFERLNAINLAFRTSTTLFAIATADNLFISGNMSHAYGRDFLGCLLKSTPSDYFISKKDILVQENLYNSLSNDKYSGGIDYGDSIVLASYVDFGLAGVVFIYPIFILLLLSIVRQISISNPYLQILFVFGFTYTGFTMMEGTMISILVACRTFFITALLIYPFILLFQPGKAAAVHP